MTTSKKPTNPNAHGAKRAQVRDIRVTDRKQNATKTTDITIDKTTGKLAGVSVTSTTRTKRGKLTPQAVTSIDADVAKARNTIE